MLWSYYAHEKIDFKNEDHNDLYSRGKQLHHLNYGDKNEEQIANVYAANLSLKDAIQHFKSDSKNSAKAWGVAQFEKYEVELAFLQQEMGDCRFRDLTYEKVRDGYINKLHKIPKNMKKNKLFYSGNKQLMSTDNIITIAQSKKLETLSLQTCKSKANKIKSFLRFCSESRHIDKDILDVFIALEKTKSHGKKRIHFSDNHLKLMFERDEFAHGIWFKKYIWRHWGLLLALYTGARINEICQLDVADIMKDRNTEIDYIKFQSGEGKRLKNKNAHREVPIHNELIKLGFLDYVATQKSKKQTKLFSELTIDNKGAWSKKLKTWFNETYLKKAGVDKFVSERHASLSFHGIRATFINQGK